MSHWNALSSTAPLSTAHPTAYADRLRIREPGDSGFALGPHVDNGSCERWERTGYGLGGVYDSIFAGEWENYDAWEASRRLPVVSDLYNGAGACSMFRMYQGWLAMSTTGPNEGTLLVNPLLGRATAYMLLRPFFEPVRGTPGSRSFLDEGNWRLEASQTSALQGAAPAHCQELNDALHPHLDLANTMVHVPTVHPGDYVAWHCDSTSAFLSCWRWDTGQLTPSVQRSTPSTESMLAKQTLPSFTFPAVPSPKRTQPTSPDNAMPLRTASLHPTFLVRNLTFFNKSGFTPIRETPGVRLIADSSLTIQLQEAKANQNM